MKNLPLGIKIIFLLNCLLIIFLLITSWHSIKPSNAPIFFVIGTPILANLGFIYKKNWAKWVMIIYYFTIVVTIAIIAENDYSKSPVVRAEDGYWIIFLLIGGLVWTVFYLFKIKIKNETTS